jgi:lysophospholipase L1-like esterase
VGGPVVHRGTQAGNAATFYNLGVRQNTTQDILARWETECGLRLPSSCDGRVVLSWGVNDTVVEHGVWRAPLEKSVATLRHILKHSIKYTVLLVGPPPVEEEAHNERILLLSQAYAHEAKALGIPYIELFSPVVADADYRREVSSHDGSHPGSDGYAKMAQLIAMSPQWWFPRL